MIKSLSMVMNGFLLVKADHILGASQVLVEDAGGIRVAWSGDF